MENVRNYRDIKLKTTGSRNHHTTKKNSKNLLEIKLKKTQMLINKPVYLGFSMLEMSKTVMYEFWYNYIKPKYGEKSKLCYVDTDSFIVYIKTEGIYVNIVKDVETRFDTSNYELDRLLPKGKNKKKQSHP